MENLIPAEVPFIRKLRSKRGFAGQAAAGAFAVLLEIFHRIAQVLRREIRPALGRKLNSANAHSHRRKSERRCSPPVRIRRSTSVEPPRWTSASTSLKASLESAVTL